MANIFDPAGAAAQLAFIRSTLRNNACQFIHSTMFVKRARPRPQVRSRDADEEEVSASPSPAASAEAGDEVGSVMERKKAQRKKTQGKSKLSFGGDEEVRRRVQDPARRLLTIIVAIRLYSVQAAQIAALAGPQSERAVHSVLLCGGRFPIILAQLPRRAQGSNAITRTTTRGCG